jgi:glutamine amidotransferase
MITVVDYDSGNLRSVTKALEALGAEVRVTSDPSLVLGADRLIVPGVGAFGDAMEKLNDRGLVDPILEYAASGRPFLGICVGLQLMFESSEEAPGVAGLGLLPGRVRRFDSAPGRKIPHMGWNQIAVRGGGGDGLGLLRNLSGDRDGGRSGTGGGDGDLPYVYFVHSYYVEPADPALVLATTVYDGFEFCAVAGRENTVGVQFHPEKSQSVGMAILRNFAVADLRAAV